jgi:hypothetical protein
MVLGLGLGILFGGRGEGALPYQCRVSHSEAGEKEAYRPIRSCIWCCHFGKMTRDWRSEKRKQVVLVQSKLVSSVSYQLRDQRQKKDP